MLSSWFVEFEPDGTHDVITPRLPTRLQRWNPKPTKFVVVDSVFLICSECDVLCKSIKRMTAVAKKDGVLLAPHIRCTVSTLMNPQ